MSLVALALRIATVRALRGVTLAGNRVYDSSIDPIDEKIVSDPAPIIIVATDDDVREIEGRDILNATRKLDIVIEMAVAAKLSVPVENGEGEEQSVVVLDADEGFELILNLMGRQVDRALLVTRERPEGATSDDPWSDLWRSLVTKIHGYTSKRGAGVIDKGRRFAARQVILTVDTVAEPPFDVIKESSIWSRVLTSFRADPVLVGAADLIETEITTLSVRRWQQGAADLGLRDGGAMRIGMGRAAETSLSDDENLRLLEIQLVEQPND